MSHHEHRARAPRTLAAWVITASDTRNEETDTSGRTIRDALVREGHRVAGYRILPDDPGPIRSLVEEILDRDDVEVVLINGGTGIAPRDSTFEAVSALLEKEIPGFGELFRSLSFAEIGSAAMLSRAVAGIARGKIVASMPGSTGAVRLAMEKLLLPELGHMVALLTRSRSP